MNKHLIELLLLVAIPICTCISCDRTCGGPDFPETYYKPEYASGFEIVGMKDSLSRVIRVTAPWQDADSSALELFISRGGECPPEGFRGQVIDSEASRIVAMSSSYVAMLDLIGETPRTAAVSGIDFITNTYVREHRDSIADVGSESSVDYEKLVSVRPDLVLLYGISSSSPMENMLESLGIPYMYMGEYLEPSPLGRVEWLVAMAEIAGKAETGISRFREIRDSYESLKAKASAAGSKPSVMLNVPYGDIWFMASCGSSMARMIADAGGDYIYKKNSTNKSLPIDMETAYVYVSDSDFWLNVGQMTSVRELVSSYPQFAGAEVVSSGNIYNCDKLRNPGGGNDFWEMGQLRPDLILSDLITIFHPEIYRADSLYYYRRLR